MTSQGLHERILAVVARIPRGRVATYGQLARLAGLAGHARLAGYALHALPSGTPLPWHRVVNARGMVSTTGEHAARQRRLLQRDGVRFDEEGRIDLERFQWQPRIRDRSARTSSGRTPVPNARRTAPRADRRTP